MTLQRWEKTGPAGTVEETTETEYGFYLKADNGAVVMWSSAYNSERARNFAVRRLSEQLSIQVG